jgi:hypothetical protein
MTSALKRLKQIWLRLFSKYSVLQIHVNALDRYKHKIRTKICISTFGTSFSTFKKYFEA